MPRKKFWAKRRSVSEMDNRAKRGFSIIELLISFTVLGFIALSAFSLISSQRSGTLENEAKIIASRLSGAQARAIAGVAGKQWGIHFNNSSTPPFYALFNGQSYSQAST